MKEPKYPELTKLHSILDDMEKRLHFEHWRNADLSEKLSYALAERNELRAKLSGG